MSHLIGPISQTLIKHIPKATNGTSMKSIAFSEMN